MMVNPLPGVSLERLRDQLREQGNAAANLRSPLPSWQSRDWLTAYIKWANNAARMLRGLIVQADIDRLVWAGRYQSLASKVGMLYPDLENSGLNHVLTAELDDRVIAFDEAGRTLEAQIERWSGPGVLVAFDTGVYIHNAKLEDLNIADLMGLTPGAPIRLFVPMAVVDQLDNLKQSSKPHVRWRATYSTAVLHRVLCDAPGRPAWLHDQEAAIRIELFPDPPGHVRLPIIDDEIIDRLRAAQVLVGRGITLVTYDTGQALRAGLAGIAAVRLPFPDEGSPEPTQP